MTVSDLLDRMSSSEFAGWMAFHGVGLPVSGEARRVEGDQAWADFLHFAKGK